MYKFIEQPIRSLGHVKFDRLRKSEIMRASASTNIEPYPASSLWEEPATSWSKYLTERILQELECYESLTKLRDENEEEYLTYPSSS
jgi:hypothetical protein